MDDQMTNAVNYLQTQITQLQNQLHTAEQQIARLESKADGTYNPLSKSGPKA